MHWKFKRLILLIAVSLIWDPAYSQSVSVNTTGAPATSSAILDVSSTDKGVLVPRMSKVQKNTIAGPATGLLIYQESPDSVGFHFYNGTRWMWIDTASGKNGWLTEGNSGTDSAVNFIGTVDNKPLMFRQNNLYIGQLNTRKRNYFLGAGSGSNNTTGTLNTAMGDSALFNLTTASTNTAIGSRSMLGSGPITGGANVAIGYNSLSQITTAHQNVAIGDYAMTNNKKGSVNVIIGPGTMESASGGISNIAMGLWSMRNNDSASYNIGIGQSSLYHNDSVRNIAIGFEAMAFSNRNDNMAIGFQAGYYNSYNQTNPLFGLENTYIGFGSGVYPNTGSKNTALGYRALQGPGTFGNDPTNLFYKRNVAIGDSSMTGSYGSDNVGVGFRTLSKSWNTSQHTAVGSRALSSTTATYPNTAVGYSSQDSATTAFANTSMGSFSLTLNKTGYNNTAIGNAAMYEAFDPINGSFPNNNTAIGNDALRLNRSLGNVAVGASSLRNDTVGTYNTAVGFVAMNNNLSGDVNTAVGTSALRSNLTGHGNTALGTNAMYNHKQFDYNTAVGFESMIDDTSGALNTAVGWRSLRFNRSGSENTAIGVGAIEFTDSSSRNTAVGRGAMIGITGSKGVSDNVAIGYYAGAQTDSARRTLLLGAYAGYRNQAYENSFAGYQSGYGASGFPLTGIENTGFGTHTLFFNSTGQSNTALGLGALYANRTGNGNVGIGTRALANAQNFSYNIAIGDSAMYGNNADGNVAIGTKSMWFNNTGSYNTATGNYALRNNNTGNKNVAVGDSALYTNTVGSLNTGIGHYALTSGVLTNSTAIGANAVVSQSNSMVLGSINGVNGATADTRVGIGTSSPAARLHVRSGLSGGPVIGNATMIIEDAIQSYIQLSNPNNAENGILSGNFSSTIRGGIVFGIDSSLMLRAGGNFSRLTAQRNGNIGIGTTGPQTKLHIYESTGVNVNARIASLDNSWEPGLELVKTGGAGIDWKIRNTSLSNLVFSRAADDFTIFSIDEYEMAFNTFRPLSDGSKSLGLAGSRWTTVYATVGAINTSDARDKENITDLNYGLTEIMKLRPVSFSWKENPQWGRKIGFIAQEVRPVLSEVVQVGQLKMKSDLNYAAIRTSNSVDDKLGIYYSDIIPVTVKAIQEQQQQIERLSNENRELLKKNETLERDILMIKEKLGIKNQ